MTSKKHGISFGNAFLQNQMQPFIHMMLLLKNENEKRLLKKWLFDSSIQYVLYMFWRISSTLLCNANKVVKIYCLVLLLRLDKVKHFKNKVGDIHNNNKNDNKNDNKSDSGNHFVDNMSSNFMLVKRATYFNKIRHELFELKSSLNVRS